MTPERCAHSIELLGYTLNLRASEAFAAGEDLETEKPKWQRGEVSVVSGRPELCRYLQSYFTAAFEHSILVDLNHQAPLSDLLEVLHIQANIPPAERADRSPRPFRDSSFFVVISLPEGGTLSVEVEQFLKQLCEQTRVRALVRTN